MNCPQCGNETDQFQEGVCAECCEENQQRLDQHIFEYDAWQKLTDAERDARIAFEK